MLNVAARGEHLVRRGHENGADTPGTGDRLSTKLLLLSRTWRETLRVAKKGLGRARFTYPQENPVSSGEGFISAVSRAGSSMNHR